MGLLLSARCDACGYERDGLRLGGSHAQIQAHDVSHWELYQAPCCGEVQSVLVLLGQPLPQVSCERCARALPLDPSQRYRVTTLKGEVFSGHACPRCRERTLKFLPGNLFT